MEYYKDFESTEIAELDSEDDLEREELEVALYSQIHFEENTEATLCESQQLYNYLVEGNNYTHTGFKAKETTAQLLLDRHLNGVIPGHDIIPEKAKHKNTYGAGTSRSTFIKKKDHTISNKNQTSSCAVSHDDVVSSVTETKLKKSKAHSKRKSLAEELILNINSDSDSDIIKISDNSEKDSSGDDVVSLDESSDSGESNLDGLLDDSEVEEGNMQINMHLGQRAHQDVRYDNTFDRSRKVPIDSPIKPSVARYYKPKPKTKVCCLCSEPGHSHYQCPQSLCYNCDEPGHDARDCTQPRRNPFTVCFRCRMRGHDQRKCPELWRQYHVTTNVGKLQSWKVKRRRRKLMYCYNCAGNDHYGHECGEDRMSRYVCVSSPFITRYQDDERYNRSDKNFSSKERVFEMKTTNTALIVKPARSGTSKHVKGVKPAESGTSIAINKGKQIEQETGIYSIGVDLAERVTTKSSAEVKSVEETTLQPSMAGNSTDRVTTKSSTEVKPLENFALKSSTIPNSTEPMESTTIKSAESSKFSTEVSPLEVITAKSSKRVKHNESSCKQTTSQNGFKMPQRELSKFLPSNYVNAKPTGRNNFDHLRQNWSQQKLAKSDKCIDLTGANSVTSKKRKGKKNGKSEGGDIRKKIGMTDLGKDKFDNIEGEATINITLSDSSTSHEHFLRTSNSSGSGHKKFEDYNRTTSTKALDVDQFPRNKGSGKKAKKRKPAPVARDIDMGEEDLFSWRKVKQVRGQLEGNMDEVYVSEDDQLQHQAFNNQWWENKQSKKKGKGRNRKKR